MKKPAKILTAIGSAMLILLTARLVVRLPNSGRKISEVITETAVTCAATTETSVATAEAETTEMTQNPLSSSSEHDEKPAETSSVETSSVETETYRFTNDAGDVKDFLNCAYSYYINRDALVYCQLNTPIQDDYDGNNHIDCSTFVCLALMGIDYDTSPYKGFTRTMGDFSWAYDFPDVFTVKAASLLEIMTLSALRLKHEPVYEDITEDNVYEKIIKVLIDEGIQEGDLIFYDKYEDVSADRYEGIDHVAIVYKVYNTDERKDIVILHSSGSASSSVTCASLAKYPNRAEHITAIARPILNGFADIVYTNAVKRMPSGIRQ